MKIPNFPDELDSAPLVEYLSKISEELTGYAKEDFYPIYRMHLYLLFAEDRNALQ